MNSVTENDTVLLHFRSLRPDGTVFEDTTGGEPQTVILGKGQINPEFESALTGSCIGDTVRVVLPPEKAYGVYNRRLVFSVRRKALNLNAEPKPGDLITLTVKGRQIRGFVRETTKSKIVVDANHPLAGETVTYEITVAGIVEP